MTKWFGQLTILSQVEGQMPETTTVRNCFFSIVGLLVFSSFLVSCALSLRKEVVSLHHLERCPHWEPSQLVEQVAEFDDTTETYILHCALDLLRNAEDTSVHKSAAGSQVCFLLADRTEADQVRRERFASEGVRWAEGFLKASDKENGDVYYYLAVNLGIAVKEHPAVALKNLNRLVSSLEKAIELSPDINSAGPYRVLGMVYLMAPPWPQGIGDGDKALELLQEAVRRHPDYPKNRIFYAQALWELEGEDRKQEVLEHLKEALRLLNQEKWKKVRTRWMKDLTYVADEAGVELS
jgi:tetratricopeptide (TPR) repeat protein